MTRLTRVIAALACVSAAACTATSRPPSTTGAAGIDSLNARVVRAYQTHDPLLYGTLWTDSAQFEWPAFTTVKGRAQMAGMARGNWAALKDMDLKLTVGTRHIDGDHATEFGAFEQSWNDSSGTRMTEYGRYVTYLVRDKDGRWLMDRFFGFEDSTRSAARR